MTDLQTADLVDLSTAAFGRVVGAAKYESGLNSTQHRSDQLVVNRFEDRNVLQRIVWGVRSAIGDLFRKGEHDLKRDEITFRMMGQEFFNRVRPELVAVAQEVEGVEVRRDLTRAHEIMTELGEVLNRSALNVMEREALKTYAKALLNLEPQVTTADAYRARINATLEEATDSQYEKVREDAKFRWRGVFSNLAASSLSKATSVFLSPLAGPLLGIFGVAAVETYFQREVKIRAEEGSLKAKTNQLSRALNKEIDAFYSNEGREPLSPGIPSDPQARSPMQRLRDAIHLLDNSSALSDEDKAKRFNNVSDAAHFVLENAAKIEALKGGRGQLSIVTAERYNLLKQDILELVGHLERLGVVTGPINGDYPAQINLAIAGLKERFKLGGNLDERAREDVVNVDRRNAFLSTYDFVSKINQQERVSVDLIRVEKLREIRAEATDMKWLVSKFAWNSVSSALAVLGAGARAVAESEAFRGTHMIGVDQKEFTQLGSYLETNAAKVFGQATGLNRWGLPGKMISDSCGGIIKDASHFYFDWMNGESAWSSLFDGNRDLYYGGLWEAPKPSAPGVTLTQNVNDLLSLHQHQPVIRGELEEIAKRGFSFAREFDFNREGLSPSLHNAIDFVSWMVAGATWGAAGLIGVRDAQVKNKTEVLYRHGRGFATPYFEQRAIPEVGAAQAPPVQQVQPPQPPNPDPNAQVAPNIIAFAAVAGNAPVRALSGVSFIRNNEIFEGREPWELSIHQNSEREVQPQDAPRVEVDAEFLKRMGYFTGLRRNHPIAWSGTVERVGNTYKIRDLSIPTQESCPEMVKTEVSALGVGEGSVVGRTDTLGGASIGDDQLAISAISGTGRYHVRMRANVAGELVIDVFDGEGGSVFYNVPWEATGDQEVTDFEALEEDLDNRTELKRSPRLEMLERYEELISQETPLREGILDLSHLGDDVEVIVIGDIRNDWENVRKILDFDDNRQRLENNKLVLVFAGEINKPASTDPADLEKSLNDCYHYMKLKTERTTGVYRTATRYDLLPVAIPGAMPLPGNDEAAAWRQHVLSTEGLGDDYLDKFDSAWVANSASRVQLEGTLRNPFVDIHEQWLHDYDQSSGGYLSRPDVLAYVSLKKFRGQREDPVEMIAVDLVHVESEERDREEERAVDFGVRGGAPVTHSIDFAELEELSRISGAGGHTRGETLLATSTAVPPESAPKVSISKRALDEIGYITGRAVGHEVGWMFKVDKESELEFLVSDILLLAQEARTNWVGPLQTEEEQIMMCGTHQSTGRWNFAHSHDETETTPSRIDDQTFIWESNLPLTNYSLRMITNRRGELRIDLKLDDKVYLDVPWTRVDDRRAARYMSLSAQFEERVTVLAGAHV